MKKRNLAVLFLILSLIIVYSKPVLSQDESPTSGGDVGAESISGSATDENGNTTTFDSQGNITGESGPGGGFVSESTTGGSSLGGGGDGKSGVPGGTDAGNNYSAAEAAALSAQADLASMIAAQELNGATLADQVAMSQALAAFDAAMSALASAMEAQFPGGFTYTPDAGGVAAPTGPAPAGAIQAVATNVQAWAAAQALAAPPAPPVAPIAAPAVPGGGGNSGLSISASQTTQAGEGTFTTTTTTVNIVNSSGQTVATVSQTVGTGTGNLGAGQTEISIPGRTDGSVNIGGTDITLSLGSITEAARDAGLSIPSTPGTR